MSDEKGPRRQTTPQGRIIDDCANCGKYGRIHSNTSGQELCKNCSGVAKAFDYTWQLIKYVSADDYVKRPPMSREQLMRGPRGMQFDSKRTRLNDIGDVYGPEQLERLKELLQGPRKAPPGKEKPYE